MKLLARRMIFALLMLPSLLMAQKGIDVSRFQDTINWKKVAANKSIDFVYVKASEGASIRDKMYRYNVKKAREEGLLIGSYHVYSSRTTAQQQFANFKKVVGNTKQDIIPVLDIEAVHCHKLYMARVDKLLELMEKEYGAKPMIYTSERLYMTHFNVKKYKKYHFFIANYKREPQMAYTLWQYTQHGKQKGISGFVDFSRFSSRYDIENIKIKEKDSTAVEPPKTTPEKKQLEKKKNVSKSKATKPAPSKSKVKSTAKKTGTKSKGNTTSSKGKK